MATSNSISIGDFDFTLRGYGRYNVIYTSPATGKKWQAIVEDMTIIDDTKNCDEPKKKDLRILKSICKNA